MRRLLMVSGLVVLFGLAFSFGYHADASAQELEGATLSAADVTDYMAAGEDKRGGLPACARVASAVNRACPCRGPLGEDGKPVVDPDTGDRVAWTDHTQWLDCVDGALGKLAAEHENLPEDCVDKIMERATNSEIGDPDHECPTLRRPARRLPVLRKAFQCGRVTQVVLQACPCEGKDGVAWTDHDEYVECVEGALTKIAEERENVSEKCLEGILKRAENSKIGTEGFECPKRPERPKQGEKPEPRP